MARSFKDGLGVVAVLTLWACDPEVGPGMEQPDAGMVADAGEVLTPAIVCASTPGNRLKRELIEPTAGATQELRIIDALHEVECRYQSDGQGVSTCYPVVSATSSSVYYQDDQCTSALARYPQGETPRQFTRVQRSNAVPCAPDIKEHRLVGAASPVVGGQNVFALDLVGACVARLAPAGDYYVAGPILSADDFVSATTETFSPGTRLSGLVYDGEDDSKMCASSLLKVDSALTTSCENRFDAAGVARCMPIGGSSETFFADDQCEGINTVVAQGACELAAPGYVIEETADSCGLVTRNVTAVLAEEVSDRYRIAGNNCQLINPDTNTYYKVGGAVADTEFAELAAEVEATEGRLRRMLVSSADRFAEFTGAWFDSKLDTPCVFANAGDGSLRCLPPAIPSTALFTDPLCVNAIDTLALQAECQSSPKFISKSGPMGTRIFAATPYEQTVYRNQNLACEPVTEAVFEESFEHAASSFLLGEIVRQ